MMKKPLKKIALLLGLALFSGSVLASECPESFLKQEVSSSEQLVACEVYEQKEGKEIRTFIALLDIFSESEGTQKARVRHYIQNQQAKNFVIAFSLDDIGEFFLPIHLGDIKKIDLKNHETKSLLIFDIDGDGQKEILFRSYINPTALLRIHKFTNDSEKIVEVGVVEKDFGEAEFFPYFVTAFSSQVVVEKGKIHIKNKNDAITSYVLQGRHFEKSE